MIFENSSQLFKKSPDLLGLLNIDDKTTKIAKFNYDNLLVKYNSKAPYLTQFQNDSIYEIQRKHIVITRVSVPSQYVFSILYQLIDLFKKKCLNHKLFSAYTLPSDPSSIFLEGPTINEIFEIFSIFKNVFSITEDDIIQYNNTSDIIQNVCNPLRTISIQVGKLIRISTPSFRNQVVQVIDFLSKKSQIIIKFCPKIDYELLIQKSLNSQMKLNNSMPPDYFAPLDTFQPEKLKLFIPSVEIKHKEINISWVDQPVVCNFWDGCFFVGSLQIAKINISDLILLPLELTRNEIQLFQEGLMQFEKDNENFIRNFQMSYDESYETIVRNFDLVNLDYTSKSKKLSEDTHYSNEINQNLNESNISSSFQCTKNIQNSQKNNTINLSSNYSHANQYQNVEFSSKDCSQLTNHNYQTNDEKLLQNFKVGDFVMPTIPLEKVFLKIREINNQGIIKADFLSLPFIGNSTQFIKVSPPMHMRKNVKSTYEIDSLDFQNQNNSSNKWHEKDIVQLMNKQIGIIIDKYDDTQEILFMNFDNDIYYYYYKGIENILENSTECKDFYGNKLSLYDKVIIRDTGCGEIMAIYEDNVLVKENKDKTGKFYKSSKLILNKDDLIYHCDQSKNYNDDCCDYSHHRNHNSNEYDYSKRKYYNDNGYNSSENKHDIYYSKNYNNYRFEDYNNSHRIYIDDNSKRFQSPHSSPPHINKHASSQQSSIKSKDKQTNIIKKPIWAQKNFIVEVPDDTREAIIVKIENDIASIQFIEKETKRILNEHKKYPIKELKPMKFHEDDNVVSYSDIKPIYGKVMKITKNHVYLEEEGGKSTNSKQWVLIKDTYRYYLWDSLDD